jgi:hypothetical protein
LVEPCDGDVVRVGVVEVDVDVTGADESRVAGVPDAAEKKEGQNEGKRETQSDAQLGVVALSEGRVGFGVAGKDVVADVAACRI